MRVITLNVNGIRAELKAQLGELPAEVESPPGYHAFFHPAEKRGYSGVALYARYAPERVVTGLGWPDFDAEGRFLRVDYPGLSVISLYLPSGSSSEERQQAKFDFMDRFYPVLKAMRDEARNFILCGDWNIAHHPIDLKNWRSNQKNSGFLPEERAWLDQVFGELGWVDAFRVVNQEPEQYTWWSNRGQAWAKNVGWRIDYQVVSSGLKGKILRTAIYKDERFSDHAPLTLDYDISL